MNVLLTGATGFLGAWVAHHLREGGHETCCLDSHGRWAPGNLWNVPSFLAEADAVVHLAWFSQAGRAYPMVHRYCLERFQEVVRQASWCAPSSCLHVFASTASVYGNRGDLACQEGFDLAPNCDYTRAKVEAEHHLRTWVPRRHCILRLGSLMGVGAPGGRTKTDVIVNAFASEGYRGGRIEVWNPDSYKPLLHVKDAAELVVRAVEESWQGTTNAAIACLRAREVAALASRHTGASVVLVEDRSGPRSCRVDTSRLASLLPGGWRFRSVEEAVLEFRDYAPGPRDRTVPWSCPIEEVAVG